MIQTRYYVGIIWENDCPKLTWKTIGKGCGWFKDKGDSQKHLGMVVFWPRFELGISQTKVSFTFQVRHTHCVEYKLKYNIKYKINIIQSDRTLYFY